MVDRNKVTRRSVIAGIVSAMLPTIAPMHANQATPVATPEVFRWPAPIDLSGNIQLLDWRISHTDGGSRFLSEIRNTSNEPVIAPTIGVVLPGLESSGNFGWASPFTTVIHPGESTFVVGLTPPAVGGDEDWDDAEWMLCEPGDTASDTLVMLDELDFSIESESTVHQPDWMECNMSITNLGSKPIRSMRLTGIVRDSDDRICGGTAFSNLRRVVSGETLTMTVNVRPVVEMLVSPFDFVTDLTGGSASFSLQPPGSAVNQGCPAVMPWNR